MNRRYFLHSAIRALGTPVFDGIAPQDYVELQRIWDNTDPRNEGQYMQAVLSTRFWPSMPTSSSTVSKASRAATSRCISSNPVARSDTWRPTRRLLRTASRRPT